MGDAPARSGRPRTTLALGLLLLLALGGALAVTAPAAAPAAAPPSPPGAALGVNGVRAAGGGGGQGGGGDHGGGGGDDGGQGGGGGAGHGGGGSGTGTGVPGHRLAVLVDGLSARNTSAFQPFVGTIAASVSVRNLSRESISIEARFTAANAAGLQLAGARQTLSFRPGQTRLMSASLGGIAQTGPIHVSVVVVPPPTIEGVTQKPIPRDTWVLLVPWTLAGGVAAIGCLWQLVRRVRLRILGGAR